MMIRLRESLIYVTGIYGIELKYLKYEIANNIKTR